MSMPTLDFSNMKPNKYVYSPLADPRLDIRLLELQPGAYDDEIHIVIYHTALDPSSKKQQPDRISLEEVRRSLPNEWRAYETYDHRYVFCTGHGESVRTAWEHPDPGYQGAVSHHGFEYDDLHEEWPAFEALSYVWGSPENPEDVFVLNAQSSSSALPRPATILPLGKNLVRALRHLRHTVTPRTLWIDGICINQQDVKERESQVLRMADIYSLASRVIIWLGPEVDSTGDAMDALRLLSQQAISTLDRWMLPAPAAAAERPPLYHSATELSYGPDVCSAIIELLQREWFQRVWVIQEAKLANPRAMIYCGTHRLLFADFRAAVMCLWNKAKLPSEQDLRGPVRNIVPMFDVNHHICPTEIVFRAFLSKKATDPRDKIYGLLGLLSPGLQRRIKPQYDAPVIKVYTDAVVSDITNTRRLDIIKRAGLGLPGIERPSWVQDMSTTHPMQGLILQFAALHSACCASFMEPDRLKVMGVTVASPVGEIKPENRMPNLNSDQNSYKNMLQAVRRAQPDNLDTAVYPTGETFREAYAQTLVAGHLLPRVPATYRYLVDHNTWCLQQSTNALFGESAAGGLFDGLSSLSYMERQALETIAGRTLVEFEDGHIGLCPGGTQQGTYHVDLDQIPLSHTIR